MEVLGDLPSSKPIVKVSPDALLAVGVFLTIVGKPPNFNVLNLLPFIFTPFTGCLYEDR